MRGLEVFIDRLEKRQYHASYRIAQGLRRSGVPITTLRSRIYTYFAREDAHNKERIVRAFKGYKLEYWL